MRLAALGGREETRCGSFLAVDVCATALILVDEDFGGAEERVFALACPDLAPARFTPAFSIALPCFPDSTNDRCGAEGSAKREHVGNRVESMASLNTI